MTSICSHGYSFMNKYKVHTITKKCVATNPTSFGSNASMYAILLYYLTNKMKIVYFALKVRIYNAYIGKI